MNDVMPNMTLQPGLAAAAAAVYTYIAAAVNHGALSYQSIVPESVELQHCQRVLVCGNAVMTQ